jgi:phosphatidylglycerol:prolipoprotein diacylglycerol transferase
MFTFVVNINPVLLSVGPLKIYWYGVAYVVSLLVGARYCKYLIRTQGIPIPEKCMDDFVAWMVVAIIVGGRLGHVVFYDFSYYIHNPLHIFMTWKGGMSFHGGLLGAFGAAFLFCRTFRIHYWQFGDLLAAATPIGLGLGRLANFVNQELYGTVTQVSWACIFPNIDLFPRHPSQLYEAVLEGLILWLILFFMAQKKVFTCKPGMGIGVFLAGYGLCRFCVEFVREPEGFVSIFNLFLTTGQALSLPMIGVGLLIMFKCCGRKLRQQNRV